MRRGPEFHCVLAAFFYREVGFPLSHKAKPFSTGTGDIERDSSHKWPAVAHSDAQRPAVSGVGEQKPGPKGIASVCHDVWVSRTKGVAARGLCVAAVVPACYFCPCRNGRSQCDQCRSCSYAQYHHALQGCAPAPFTDPLFSRKKVQAVSPQLLLYSTNELLF